MKWNAQNIRLVVMSLMSIIAILAVLKMTNRTNFLHQKTQQNLITDDEIIGLKKIVLREEDRTLTLTQEGTLGLWYVSPKDDQKVFADGTKIKSMLDKFMEAKIVGRQPQTSDDDTEYGFKKGIIVELYGQDSQLIKTFYLGDNDPKVGRYIRINDDKAVYLTNRFIHVYTKSDDWMLRRLIAIKEDDIKALRVKDRKNKVIWDLARKDQKEPLYSEKQSSSLKPLMNRFNDLRFNKIIEKTSQEGKKIKKLPIASLIEIQLWSGESYKMTLYRDDHDKDQKKYYLEGAVLERGNGLNNEQQIRLTIFDEFTQKGIFEISEYIGKNLLAKAEKH